MWLPLVFEQLHFAINVLAALIMFGAFWLYYDAWSQRKSTKEALRMLGFFFLSLSFLVAAAQLETPLLPASFWDSQLISQTSIGLRMLGYVAVLVSLLLDPIQPRPHVPEDGLPGIPVIALLTSGVFAWSVQLAQVAAAR